MASSPATLNDSSVSASNRKQETLQEYQEQIGDKEEAEEEELESFEDFTLATPWERFIAAVEGAIRQWQVVGIEGLQWQEGGIPAVPQTPFLHSVYKEIRYGTQSFGLSLYFPSSKAQELASEKEKGQISEWDYLKHPIQIFFGTELFLVLSPLTKSGIIFDPSDASLLLSTLACALSSSQCSWPGFVSVYGLHREVYKGIQQFPGSSPSFRFESDQLHNRVPPVLVHLEGLYDFFSRKLVGEVPHVSYGENPKVTVSMRLVFRVPSNKWDQEMDENSLNSVDEDAEDSSSWPNGTVWDENCPWGEWHSMENPIRGYLLTATWHVLVANSSSDIAQLEMLSPLSADQFSLSLIPTHEKEIGADEWPGFAGRLRLLVRSLEGVREAKLQHMDDFVSEDGRAALRRIGGRTYMAVPSQSIIQRVLKDLFSEVHKPEVMRPGKKTKFKTAPPESLFSRLSLHALRFGDCNVKAIATLWKEFRAEVSWYWDETKPLPRVSANGPPDFSSCLIHQKLQMLAICIRRKIEIEKKKLEDRATEMHARQSKHRENLKIFDVYGTEERDRNLNVSGGREEDGKSVYKADVDSQVHTEYSVGKVEGMSGGKKIFSLEDSANEIEDGDAGGDVGDARNGWERIDDLTILLPRSDSDRTVQNEDSKSTDSLKSSKSLKSTKSSNSGSHGKVKSQTGPETNDYFRESEEESDSTVYESLPDVDSSSDYQDFGREESASDSNWHGEGEKEGEREGGREAEREGARAGERGTEKRGRESGQREIDACFGDEYLEQTLEKTAKGLLKPAGDRMLLQRPVRMFIPIIQEEVYMTEDAVRMGEETLMALGDSSSAAETRARVQAKSLSSDMSAFKAANPGSVLEDFVRWYSPKDWIPQTSSNDAPTVSKKIQKTNNNNEPEDKTNRESHFFGKDNMNLNHMESHPKLGNGQNENGKKVQNRQNGNEKKVYKVQKVQNGHAQIRSVFYRLNDKGRTFPEGGGEEREGEGEGSFLKHKNGENEGYHGNGPRFLGLEERNSEIHSSQQRLNGMENGREREGDNARESRGESETHDERGGAREREGAVNVWPPRGQLSERMQTEGNLWRVLWDTSPPLPANEQRPLFDYEKEAQKALHYLDTIQPLDLMAQILSTAFTASLDVMARSEGSHLPPVAHQQQRLISEMEIVLDSCLSQDTSSTVDYKQDEIWNLCDNFQNMELISVAATSISQKLGKSPNLVASLLQVFLHEIDGVDLPKTSKSKDSSSGNIVDMSEELLSERNIVATLFTPQTRESRTLNRRKVRTEKMGNQLNGHEPMEREVIFQCPMWSRDDVAVKGDENFEDLSAFMEKEGDSMTTRDEEEETSLEGLKSTRSNHTHQHRMYTKTTGDNLIISISIGSLD